MDIASLPEAEQLKLQQLQVQFEQHRAQQEQAQRDHQLQQQQQLRNQQALVPQPHDPSQYHQYRDQSSQSHDYPHYQHHPHQNQPQNHHHYAPQFDPRHGYYRSDRASTYRPPGPFQPQALAARFGSAQHHQNVYYPTQPPPAAYPDLNVAAAAAAALSQLNQIAGTMSAAGNIGHGPMRPQARRPRYPVDGPFKHRRGRNQVPWGHLLGKSSNLELPVAKDAETIDGEGPSAPEAMLPEISSAASSSGKAAANPKPKQSARCELCKVDCSSLEVLNEKHNNGKKHKKNVLRAEKKSKNAIKSIPAVQGEQKLVAESISEVPKQTETQQNCEENKPIIEDSAVEAVEAGGDGNQVEAEQQKDTGEGPAAEINLKADQTETQQNCEENKPMIEDSAVKAVEAGGDGNQVESEQQKDTGHSEGPAAEIKLNTAGGDGNQVESEQQKDTGHSEGPAAEIKLNTDQPDNRRGLRKRKRRTEPSIPKVVIPLVCELCNVKCNTRDTFDCHLAGRKHIYKLKTFHRHQAAAYRPTGLQVLYPPNPILQTLLHPRYHQQQFQIPRSSFPPPAAYAPPPQAQRQALPLASGIDLQLQAAAPHPGGQTAVSVIPIAQKPELATQHNQEPSKM